MARLIGGRIEDRNKLSPESVRTELDKILASAAFHNAPQLSCFLRFVVEASLRGDAAEIKESIIGVKVFRDRDFDPSASTRVRVQARNLRRKLKEYYATEGPGDPVLITLPTGTYAPLFNEFKASDHPEAGEIGELNALPDPRDDQAPEYRHGREDVASRSESTAPSSQPPGAVTAISREISNGAIIQAPERTAGTAVDRSRTSFQRSTGSPVPLAPDERLPVDTTLRKLPSRRLTVVVRNSAWLALAFTLGIGVLGYLLVRPLPTPTIHNLQHLTNDGRAKSGPTATDGLRIYFSQKDSTGRTLLRALSVTGGESATIPTQLDSFEVLDISADRSSLLLGVSSGQERPFWLQPLPAGSLHRVGTVVGHGAAFSPDGLHVAFGNGNELYVANADGSTPRRITSLTGEAMWIRWSPDGRTIALTIRGTSSVTPSESLWQVSGNGGGLHEILPGVNTLQDKCCGVWTPDGNFFLFSATQSGKTNIWAIRERGKGVHWHGGQPVQLTDLPGPSYRPFPALDGKTIFFVHRAPRPQLERFSESEKQFIPFLEGIGAEWVTYSRDERWIAYIKTEDKTLWRMKSDGTEARQLTSLPMKAQGLAWSPDRQQIVVNAWTEVSRYKNYLVSAAGGAEPRELLPGYKEREGIATWSPDGRKLAFGDVPEVFGLGTSANVIHIMDLATRKLETLPGSQGFWSPRWSPDGRYIAAVKDDDPDRQLQRLYLFDLLTGRRRPLEAHHVNNATWSHDGKYIYYDGLGGHDGIFRVSISDGRAELVASLSGVERWSDDWSGLTPEDCPLILGDAGNEELYSAAVSWH